MLTFDSFTIAPAYSNISSRTHISTSSILCNYIIDLPIINANMHAISCHLMCDVMSRNNVFSSYHRIYSSLEKRKSNMLLASKYQKIFKLAWVSVGTKIEEYDYVDWLFQNNFRNIIVDVNHGHHVMVKNIVEYIKRNCPTTNIMAGNVSTNKGIDFLANAGADIIKIGNSFGNVCSTLAQTAIGVHPLHVAKTYKDSNKNSNVKLCLDGGIRNVGDIAKSLIWGDLVMLGAMLAGSNESANYSDNDSNSNAYYGNASLIAKQINNANPSFIEGTSKRVNHTGPLQLTLDSIKQGLQSSFSFVNAANLTEWQTFAPQNIIEL